MQKQHSEMVNRLMKPGKDILSSLDATRCDMIHNTMGMVGEVGEVMDAANNSESNDELVLELGDYEFYFEGLLQTMGRKRRTPKIPEGHHPTHTLPALVKHTLELNDAVKKFVIYDKPLNLVPFIKKIENCLSDVYCVLERASQFADPDAEPLNRNTVLKRNIEKLSKRYPSGKYTNKDARERKDK